MKRKTILGIFLIIFFFSFLFLFYITTDEKKLIEKKTKIELVEKENIEISKEQIEGSNIMEDVSYSAKDIQGNEYYLKANEGIIDQNENNYIFLKSVKAIIKLKNYKFIEISSDFGKYNINNYDTIFSKNVIITYLDNEITGDYLDFSLDKNLMIVSRDVIMKSSKRALQADVIEVNLDTRDIRIFMYEENKKVNIKSFN